jgi:hypothetical protein
MKAQNKHTIDSLNQSFVILGLELLEALLLHARLVCLERPLALKVLNLSADQIENEFRKKDEHSRQGLCDHKVIVNGECMLLDRTQECGHIFSNASRRASQFLPGYTHA